MPPKPVNDPELRLDWLKDELDDLQADLRATRDMGLLVNVIIDDPQQAAIFRARLSCVDATFERFTTACSEALMQSRTLELDTTELKEMRSATRTVYYEILTFGQSETKPPSTQPTQPSFVISSPHTGGDKHLSVRLPKISVPTFDGDITNWSSFKDMFTSLVHENRELANIQKFYYLKASLKGAALQVISTIPLSADEYQQAWTAIVNRYDNKRLIATNYLTKIFNFKYAAKHTVSFLEQFSAVVLESAQAFQNLNLEDPAGFILCTFALRLLDGKTKERFEMEHSDPKTLPSFNNLSTFVQTQCLHLRTSALTAPSGSQEHRSVPNSRHVLMSVGVKRDDNVCPNCQATHRLYECSTFKALSPKQRFERIKTLKRCFNCMALGHSVEKCSSSVSCRQCSRRHHTLLHCPNPNYTPRPPGSSHDRDKGCPTPDFDKYAHSKSETKSAKPETSGIKSPSSGEDGTVLSASIKGGTSVLLGTAILRAQNQQGGFQTVRGLIDCGSQRSFMTAACAQRLSLNLRRSPQRLVGLGSQSISGGKSIVSCTLIPRHAVSPIIQTEAIVLDNICSSMPTCPVSFNVTSYLDDQDLADPDFGVPGRIDILLGADVFGDIVTGGVKRLAEEGPRAMQTIFGWILMGTVPKGLDTSTEINSFVLTEKEDAEDMKQVMTRFWEIEEISSERRSTNRDDPCEDHFVRTHSRDESGRYVVALPFVSEPMSLVSSKYGALYRFQKLEQRFAKEENFKMDYDKVIREYLTRGYVAPATSPGQCFLPHHGVTKQSTTTKLRVVFDASAATAHGSLNSMLLTGPKLQRDIWEVLLRFRVPRYAMVADIVKMYLQIRVTEKDCRFQHFFYRFNATDAVVEYQFQRLSFGMSCSPFLALRVIKQLMMDEGGMFPRAVSALDRNIYIDDILTGADTLEAAKTLQEELIQLLRKGGFELQKWRSNCPQLLKDVSAESPASLVSLSDMEDSIVKLLGLVWNPDNDALAYHVQLRAFEPTKRGIMSVIARMYDPLGYLSPVTFQAKCILQQLWEANLGWDDPVPSHLGKLWNRFFSELPELIPLQIPRCIFVGCPERMIIVGFADASSRGYAALVYLRVTSTLGDTRTTLLLAKTRLAPLKYLSIPRLELCAALLLAQLVTSLRDFLATFSIDAYYLFSDSATVLSWLHLPSSRLKTFVANRTSKILEETDLKSWHHVRSESNAADIASRGSMPSEFMTLKSWWEGPEWLKDPPNLWPIKSKTDQSSINLDLPELKPVLTLLTTNNECFLEELCGRFSSYTRLLQGVAWLCRFVQNAKDPHNRRSGVLSVKEVSDATVKIIMCVQGYHFKDELPIHPRTSVAIKRLRPFLDSRGLVRVGGRLKHAPLSWETKHPILLPKDSNCVRLLVNHLHQAYLHAGPHLLQSLILRRYWILSARRVIRSQVFKCLICHRLRAKTFAPLMGDLPRSRFEQGRPFINVGLDFAGPFLIRESMRRKAAVTKAYICLFVCLGTKAVHIEVVSQLTTDAFLACLDRFVARRGLPSRLYSDNATNFVGASRKLQELNQWWHAESTKDQMGRNLRTREINWHFIPPAAPHFGGLWEAGIKSLKFHLCRIIADKPLTYEELATIAARVEAVLNSRPLIPLSSDPETLDVLTPGHFLIGEALLAPPDPDFADRALHLLNRWQFLQRCIGDLWKRWRADYLTCLTQRKKWVNHRPNLTPGTMVLLKDSNIPVLHWPTGRIVEVIPGEDKIVRVVKVQTSKGIYLRPATRLAPLFPPDGGEN